MTTLRRNSESLIIAEVTDPSPHLASSGKIFDKCSSSLEFRSKVFQWLESTIDMETVSSTDTPPHNKPIIFHFNEDINIALLINDSS